MLCLSMTLPHHHQSIMGIFIRRTFPQIWRGHGKLILFWQPVLGYNVLTQHKEYGKSQEAKRGSFTEYWRLSYLCARLTVCNRKKKGCQPVSVEILPVNIHMNNFPIWATPDIDGEVPVILKPLFCKTLHYIRKHFYMKL